MSWHLFVYTAVITTPFLALSHRDRRKLIRLERSLCFKPIKAQSANKSFRNEKFKKSPIFLIPWKEKKNEKIFFCDCKN
jgi:hypothetical protein